MAKLIYDYWFLQFDFPDENGKPYKSSGGKMVWNEQLKKEIPLGWTDGIYKDLFSIGNGRDHKHLENGNIPVYGSGGVMRYVNQFIFSGESVLIPRKGTLNNIIYVDRKFWTVDTMFYSVMKRDHCAKYVYFDILHYDFEKLNTGTGVPSMTSEIIYNLKTILPPDELLAEFENHLSPIFKNQRLLEIENDELSLLRDWLLPMLMNGQVEIDQ